MPSPTHNDPKMDEWAKDETLYEFRRVTLERTIYNSMQSLVRHGRLLFDTSGQLILEAGTDYRFAPATLPLFEKVLEAHGMRFQMGTKEGYKNFLKNGVMEFALLEQDPKPTARDYFRRLKAKFPDEVRNQSFDEYCEGELYWFTNDMTAEQCRFVVKAEIAQAFFCLGCNADDKAAFYESKAKWDADRWNVKAIPNLRGMLRYQPLKEAVLTDILMGKSTFPPEVIENLKTRLNQTKDGVVQAILENVRKAQEKPKPEDVDEKWKKQELY